LLEWNANFAERAYGHRAFEHNKRNTFAIIHETGAVSHGCGS